MKLLNTYQMLPEQFHHSALPDVAPDPHMIIFNIALAEKLGVDDASVVTKWMSGKELPDNAKPIAQAYAGHQFGQLNRLGDGRATLLGEVQTTDGLVDLQLKGSGRTAYSRHGDGKANLAPMLREYIMSEALFAMGIPTTRSLAVITTGEAVRRREHRKGAVLARVATSHIRVGTFVYAAMTAQNQGDFSGLEAILYYTIKRHYPELTDADNPALALLDKVIDKQAELVAHWQRVGFVHGVLNTDNVTVSGETIDYGPCAFMEGYDDACVFSSIDEQGRYAFGNQAPIMQWNIARFAESLLPLIHPEHSRAVELATNSIDGFESVYQMHWNRLLCAKMGLPLEQSRLANHYLALLQDKQLDYTNSFIALTQYAMGKENDLPEDDAFLAWLSEWETYRLNEGVSLMQSNNPIIIPRNHLVERALSFAEQGDLTVFNALHNALESPYDWDNIENMFEYQQPAPQNWTDEYQTFCGT